MHGQLIIDKISDSEELEDFKKLFESTLSSSNLFAEQRDCAYPAEEREDDAPHSGASGCEAFR